MVEVLESQQGSGSIAQEHPGRKDDEGFLPRPLNMLLCLTERNFHAKRQRI
jgi:hypothetical protein